MTMKKIINDLGYLALKHLDEYIGVMKVKPNPDARNKLKSTIKWIRENDIEALNDMFEQNKRDFAHIENLVDALAYLDPRTGIFVDNIDHLIFYRERCGDEMHEIFRFDEYGYFFYRGRPLTRNFQLYSDLLAVLGS